MAGPNQLYDFGRVHHKGQFCDFFVNFGPLVQEEKSFKDISCLELWRIRCSVEWNRLCKIGGRHHGLQICEIKLLLGQWFRRKPKTRSHRKYKNEKVHVI